MPNPVVRWQIISAEPGQSAAFYQKLFAWKLSTANALGYRELSSGSPPGVEGGVWPGTPGTPSFAQLFIEVENLDDTIDRAAKLWAQIIVPKAVLPDGDTMAVLRDPAGLPFAVCTRRTPPVPA